jgi:hypothetical protein
VHLQLLFSCTHLLVLSEPRLWGVVTSLPLRLSVDEAAAAAVRLGRARSSHTGRFLTTQTSAKAEGDGGQEEAGHGCPGESHEVAADMGFIAIRAEGVATFDDPDTI